MSLKRRLSWIIPVVIFIVGFVVLFVQSLFEVTEPPEEDWSRSLSIGEVNGNKYPYVKEENGQFQFIHFENHELVRKIYDEQFTIVDQSVYNNVEFNKWIQASTYGDTMLYHDSYNIFDGSTNEEIVAANKFYPLDETVLFLQESTLFQLNVNTLQYEPIISFEEVPDQVIPKQETTGIHFLAYKNNEGQVNVTLYELYNGQAEPVLDQVLSISSRQTITEVDYAVTDNKVAMIVKVQNKAQNTNEPESFTYFVETNDADSQNQLQEIRFMDPKVGHTFGTVSDLSLSYFNDKVHVLFSTTGSTNTKFRDPTAINIYEAVKQEDSWDVYRRSNTPSISTEPQWLSENTIMWMEEEGVQNTKTINVSSGDSTIISMADKTTTDDWLLTLGKATGLLSVSFIGIPLLATWFLLPIVFVFVVPFFINKALDQEPKWVYYGGIGVYLAAAVIFKHLFFIDNVYHLAPDYLLFNFSEYAFIFGFAAVAYLCTSVASKSKDWSRMVQLVYFIRIHVLLLSLTFGIYLI